MPYTNTLLGRCYSVVADMRARLFGEHIDAIAFYRKAENVYTSQRDKQETKIERLNVCRFVPSYCKQAKSLILSSKIVFILFLQHFNFL